MAAEGKTGAALPIRHQVALTLHTPLGGLTTAEIATTGDALIRHDLRDEAIRLCRLAESLIRKNEDRIDVPLSQNAEILGLPGLMLLNHSRRHDRVGKQGELVLLDRQDRSLWDRKSIEEGLALLDVAVLLRQPGPYQLKAAISAAHARAAALEGGGTLDGAAAFAVGAHRRCPQRACLGGLNHSRACHEVVYSPALDHGGLRNRSAPGVGSSGPSCAPPKGRNTRTSVAISKSSRTKSGSGLP